jgi:hypothetical protein
MRLLIAVRLGLVLAVSCVVLAGCGSAEAPTDAAKPTKTSDGPGYSGHPDLPARSSLTPSERIDLTVGQKAKATEFEEVASVVHGYLDARAEGDWELACSLVSPTGQRLLQGSAEKEGSANTSCPAALPQNTTGSPEELQKEASLADVGSVRIAPMGGGAFNKAFATYRVANALRLMSLTAVSGEWEIWGPNPVKRG